MEGVHAFPTVQTGQRDLATELRREVAPTRTTVKLLLVPLKYVKKELKLLTGFALMGLKYKLRM